MNASAGRTARAGRFALFREPDFLHLWLAGGFSGTIRWLETLAVGLYTFHETGSPFLVTAMLFARTLPSMLLGAPIGALAARFDRKRLLAAGFAVLTLAALALLGLALAGRLTIWHVVVFRPPNIFGSLCISEGPQYCWRRYNVADTP